ncbi:hypothetical protein DO97_17660 [Neosynechococcus sphagnicola sy1]|uniref:Uncharacterized protein n=1 Tax=Neosynechococcus sphagnicola sy1 TaxID=1497020 RepID=A0A098TL33_9CYAN|nr:hypothetical protein [Neosynechococcus sphagnicola]KGF71553.1 hypothetical protein DO97_17660 [Neosynechococcus sphagnicola sy1]
MGVAYYIAFNKEELAVDFTDGKSVARAIDDLNRLAEELGVKPLEAFMGQSVDDIADMLGEEIVVEDGSDGAASWFDPVEGIAVLDALILALQSDPKRLMSSQDVVEDLQSYKDALLAADTHKAKWHLAIDF